MHTTHTHTHITERLVKQTRYRLDTTHTNHVCACTLIGLMLSRVEVTLPIVHYPPNTHAGTHTHMHTIRHHAPDECNCSLAHCSEVEGLQLVGAGSPRAPLFLLPSLRLPGSAVRANRAATTSHRNRQALSPLLGKGQSLAIKATHWGVWIGVWQRGGGRNKDSNNTVPTTHHDNQQD